jgi:adenylate kinase family enzyme
MNAAAKKILILGNGDSGKTTLALQLHQAHKLPILHLGQIYWTSGYAHTDRSEFLTKVQSFCEKKEWIIEGAPMPGLALRSKSADLIIILDYPVGRCIAGVLKRSLIHFCLRRQDHCG